VAGVDDLKTRVDAIEWYHTLELAPGLTTPGFFDTRAAAERCGFPKDLAGKRCLDVGTFDGFWAFEMEKRGAAEVVAIDILDPTQWDWPINSTGAALEALASRKGQGEGFEVARQALKSGVKRLELSIYDLDPATVGRFDFVYVGSILLHLRDPVRAIEAVVSVCAGEALFVDAIDLPLTLTSGGRPAASLDGRGRPWWWRPNVAGLVRMVESGGFTPIGKPKRFLMPPGPGLPAYTPRGKDVLKGHALAEAFVTRRGDPHAALRGRPTVA
jgi:tRNA (mo5U34)-methyltransferase